MELQKPSDYALIEKAIEYYKSNANAHYNLDEIAQGINHTPTQFHDLFNRWANISPTPFFRNIQLRKKQDNQLENQGNLFENKLILTHSKTNNPPNSLIHIEEMTRKMGNDNEELELKLIEYNFYKSSFGTMLLANTEKGICYASFIENESISLSSLNIFFPNCKFQQQTSSIQENARLLFQEDRPNIKPIVLHAKGSRFQLEVWHELIKIPMGQLSTYGAIAQKIGRPKASRAVGTAIGQNPIAFFIPCHRVVQASGKFGGYMWGNTRKTALIGWELSKEHFNLNQK